MFYYISGKLAHLDPAFAVVDAGGVGYKMSISHSTFAQISAKKNTEDSPSVTLYTYMAVREDGIELFGFSTTDELDSFKLLITVSGVGPKAAVSILSLLSPRALAIAICTDDKKTISKANGVGPKTAARIVLELKDKLKGKEIEDVEDDGALSLAYANDKNDKRADALSALSVLGYTKSEAEAAIRKIDISALEVDDIIKEALKKLMK